MGEVSQAEPGRAFFLFLLRNDQRRHLHMYYENIDQSRIELQLPFFDARLIEIIVSSPVEPFLMHKFYHKWLEYFPKDVVSVPWQTYPGHELCPLYVDGEYKSQWHGKIRHKNFFQRLADLRGSFKFLFKPDCTDNIISKYKLILTMPFHLFNIRDYSYIYKFCDGFTNFYNQYKNKP